MMFEILEPCRVLHLGTSSKKYICKTNKSHDKSKNRKEKMKWKREQKRASKEEKESK